MVTGIAYTLTNVKYIASQKILIGEEKSELIDTYQEIVKGSTVLEAVIQNLGLHLGTQELSNLIEVSVKNHTNMMEIKVFGEKEEEVRAISSEISNVFIAKVNEIYGDSKLYSVDSAADYYTNGNTVLIGICSAFVGLFVSCLFFVVGWLLDTKIKSCKDIEEITDVKSLISIPNIKLIAKKKLNIKNIRAHKSEVFKTLMTNIQFVDSNNLQSKTILITSPNQAEGKTYVATNLAIEFAKAGKKVILIDGDMRRGRIAKIFNLPNDLGFSNYLSNLDSNGNVVNERITRFINDTEIKNLSVITAGNVPPNPMELLKVSKLEELLKDLKIFYDIILFDTVSLLEAPEAEKLSQLANLTFILSSYGKTKKEDLKTAYEQIENNSGCYIGMGFNKIPETRFRKKLMSFKNTAKKRLQKVVANSKIVVRKIKMGFGKLWKNMKVLKSVYVKLILGLHKGKNMLIHVFHSIRSKIQEVKESIQKYKNKKERIKLIEAGGVPEEEKKNVVKEVFEEEIIKLEADELAYRKKLDSLKANIEIKSAEVSKPKPVVAKVENQEKSKFDLIREQQKRETQEEIKEKTEQETEQEKVEIEPSEVVEVIKEEKDEKKIRQEKIDNYEEIDLSKQEQITEEMIRKQVEMDDLIRLAEKEEAEEYLRLKQEKKEERIRKREAKIEQRLKKLKEKEEKKASRELEKQRQRDELRMQEELQEDNLYPRPRI